MTNEEKILEMLGKLSGQMDTMQEQTNIRFNAIERRLDSIENRLDAIENRMDAIENRMDAIENRMDAIENRIDTLEAAMKKTQGQVEGLQIQVTKNRKEMHERFDKLEPLTKYAWDEIDLVDIRAAKKIAIHELDFHGVPLPKQFAE